MQASIHLTFDGRCAAAFAYYARTLGATPGPMLRYADSPAASQVPADWRDKIVHGSVTVAGTVLAGADAVPDAYERPRGFYVLLSVADVAEARRMFDALARDGVIHMALQETFWSPSFGVVVDQFGIPWEISCEGAPAPPVRVR